MLFLGIDPGTRVAGYGVVKLEGANIHHVAHGVCEAPTSSRVPERLQIIGAKFEGLIEEMKPAAMIIETAFFGKNAKSALSLGEARGLFMYIAARSGMDVFEVSPKSVKKGITGNGNATKEQLRVFTLGTLNIVSNEKLDATDALSMALYLAQRYSLQQKLGDQISIL